MRKWWGNGGHPKIIPDDKVFPYFPNLRTGFTIQLPHHGLFGIDLRWWFAYNVSNTKYSSNQPLLQCDSGKLELFDLLVSGIQLLSSTSCFDFLWPGFALLPWQLDFGIWSHVRHTLHIIAPPGCSWGTRSIKVTLVTLTLVTKTGSRTLQPMSSILKLRKNGVLAERLMEVGTGAVPVRYHLNSAAAGVAPTCASCMFFTSLEEWRPRLSTFLHYWYLSFGLSWSSKAAWFRWELNHTATLPWAPTASFLAAKFAHCIRRSWRSPSQADAIWRSQ